MNSIFEMLIKRSRMAPEPPEPSIPTDYVFYASLRDRSATSESGHTLTYSSSNIQPTVVDGVPCMNFLRSATGSSNAKISTDFSLVSNTSPFTISCWMWLDSNSYDSGLWGVSGFGFRASVLTSSYNYALHTTIYENPLTGRIFSSPSPTVKAWHCIVFTGDGNGACTLYIDGANVGTSTYTNYTQSYNLQIGNGTGNNSFNGYMAAVRFYRRALTGDEITALYNENFSDSSDSSSSGGSDSSSSSTGGIPTDYAFYAPLTTDYADHSTYARTMSYNTTAPTFTVNDGIPCAEMAANTGIYTLDATGFELGNHDRTLSGWVRLTATNQSWPTIIWSGYDRTQQSVHFTYNNGGMMGASAGIPTSPTFPVDTAWHHHLARYDATTSKLAYYVDGNLVSNTTFSGGISFPSNTYFGIACCPPSSYKIQSTSYFSGVRFYNRAVTDEEIAALASEDFSQDQSDSSSSSGGSAPTDYVFRAPLATSLDDVSASARTATESGGSATVGEVKDGVTCTYIPQAVRIKYQLGDVSVGSADRTFSVWFWTTSSVSWGSLMTVGANSTRAMFCIGTRTSSSLPVFSANGADLEPSSPSLKDGAWHHICASLSGTLVSLYVDGTLLGTKTITGINTSQTDICIGGRPNVTSDIAQNAWYADARIYNRALSASEVAALASRIN